MAPPVQWALTELQLKDCGVDLALLHSGLHQQVAGLLTLQVIFSLSRYCCYENLGMWWAQLEGVDQMSLSRNKGNVKYFIDGLQSRVRKAQLSKGRTNVADVLNEIVSFPKIKELDQIAVIIDAAVAEEHRAAQHFKSQVEEAANEQQALSKKLQNAQRCTQYAQKRRHDDTNKTLSLQQAVTTEIIKKYRQTQRQLKRTVPMHSLQQAEQRIAQLQRKVQQLKTQLADTSSELHTALEMLELKDEIDSGRVVITKDGSAFNNNMRQMVMSLVAAKVPFTEVGSVLESVSSGVGVKISCTPSARTIGRIAAAEMVSVAQQQLAEVLPTGGALTLMTDETSKGGQQSLVTAAAVDTGACYLLSLRDLGDKSGGSMLQKLNETLADLGQVSGSDPNTFAGELFLCFRNTQSDRASTCLKLNDLIGKFRQEIAPKVVNNWNALNDLQRKAYLQVRNFYCGLHLLVNFADTLTSVLRKHEELVSGAIELGSVSNGVGFKCKNEPGVYRLVRTLCKAFANHGGKDNVTQYHPFQLYLKQHNVILPKFANFKGNRFNVLFYNSEIAFLCRSVVADFVNATGGDTRLNKAILADLQVPLFVAELKVLGLIGKTITSPLWRILESNVHISALTEVYQKLLDWLNHQALDPTDFLLGASPFPLSIVVCDAAYDALIIPDATLHSMAEAVAIVSLQALANYLKRAVADQLPGGTNFDLSCDLHLTASVPKTNKFPETIFGFFDHLTRKRPNATMLANEALIMYIKNNTGKWLKNKSTEERNQILFNAQADQKRICRDSVQRLIEVESVRAQKLVSRIATQEKRAHHGFQRNERLMVDIQKHGLWQKSSNVDSCLQHYSTDVAKCEAVKGQLRFRKHVLRQPAPGGDSSVFAFSVAGQNLSLEQLVMNLLKLIEVASLNSTCVNAQDPFVGRDIQHFFHDISEWCNGFVIDSVPGYPAFYNIVYDSQPETVYTFKLHDEFANGDLHLVPLPATE